MIKSLPLISPDSLIARKMEQSANQYSSLVTKFSKAADVSYGSILCLCFLIGTFGNIISFLYFKSKKRDISNVIYMLISANDIVVCIASLPMGISFLSNRHPGIVFGNKYGCAVWLCAWRVSLYLSLFLVSCLCVARTVSLLRPFLKQKLRYLIIAVTLYVALYFGWIAISLLLGMKTVKFYTRYSQCWWDGGKIIFRVMDSVIDCFVYTTPALTMSISCVMSAVVLTRRNRNVQQTELQQSRNRATVTILLFALLFGVCNGPLVVHITILTFNSIASQNFSEDIYTFDTQSYYSNAIYAILPAVNSAANPILYFWRMQPLREYTVTSIIRKTSLRPNRVQVERTATCKDLTTHRNT